MKLFVIEAYGGPHETDGQIVHFAVRADTAAQAINFVRASGAG